MKVSTLKFVLVISLILNISVFISAGYTYYRQHRQLHNPAFACDFQKGSGYPFEKLGLSPKQLKAFKEKASPFHAAVTRKRHEIFQKRSSLLTLMREEKPDKQATDMAIDEINLMQKDLQKMIISNMLELKAMLDRDRQKKFMDAIEQSMAGKMDMQCR